MDDKCEDLGLSLSLSLKCPGNEKPNPPPQQPPPPFPLNLLQPPLAFMQRQNHKSPTCDPFQLAADRRVEGRSSSSQRGMIDMNTTVTGTELEEEMIVSSPNSTVSSVSGKRSEREENEGERAYSSMEEDGGGEAAGRKKLRLTKEQGAVLEETFKEQNTLTPKQKLDLAKQLNLRPRQVEVWFQNRRARTKLKQTEVDCEYLRRCCENLTEENRRLQKEVNELRALKLTPPLFMNMSPPTTLTMCPQCERVAVSSSPLSATPSPVTRQCNPVAAPHQQPIHVTSWVSMIPPQPLDARHQNA